MIVCVCRAVSDGAIRAARAAGADSVEAVAAATGAGTGCGCCRQAIAQLLAEPRPGPQPCAARAANAAPDGVPQRIAADRLKSP